MFEVIKYVLKDPAVLAENVSNIDETRAMLSVPGSIKVIIDTTRQVKKK